MSAENTQLSSDDRFAPGDWGRVQSICGWRPGQISKPPADLGETYKLLELKTRFDKQREVEKMQKLREFYKRQGLQ